MLQHYELLHQFHLQERPHQSKPYQEYRPELYRQFNRRSRYVSTGINIPANDWDFVPPPNRRSATYLRANREIQQVHQTARSVGRNQPV